MKTMLTTLLLLNFCAGFTHPMQQDSVTSDSINSNKKGNKIVRFTTRLHSSGFFNFSGRICSATPAADVSFLFEKRGYGVSVFTVRDLYDKASDNNFFFGIVYKRIKLSNRFSLTPTIGLVTENFGESGGERILIVSSFKASPKLTIDETSLFANVLNSSQKEWINRVRLIYSQTSQLQFILSNWHNNSVLDANQYLSASVQALYSRIRLSDHINAQTSVSFFVMAKSSEEISKQEKSGLMFTFAISVE